MTTSNDHTST